MYNSVLPLEPSGSRQEPSATLNFFSMLFCNALLLAINQKSLMSNSLSTLRRQNKLKRQALSANEQQQAAFWISLRIARHPKFRKSKIFVAYIATKGEISLDALIRIGLSQKKVCLLPKITDQNLLFYQYNKKHILKSGPYGIKEPTTSSRAYNLNTVDCIICPLLAFDARGNRVGMGGGYYDRALRQIKDRSKKSIWGAAHDFQQAEELAPQKWDISMDGIFTPHQYIYSIKRSSAHPII